MIRRFRNPRFKHSEHSNQGLAANSDVAFTKEVFFPMVDPGGAPFYEGNFSVYVAGPAGTVGTTFKTPNDFSSVLKVEVILIPEANDAAMDIDVATDFAAVGEARNTHTASDAASTYAVTDDQIFAMDITSLFSALQADDYVGVKITNNDGVDDIQVLGIRFQYE